MKQIEKTISPLIPSLFPSFYQDEGENFIAFVKAYYEWLEQNFQLLTLENNEGFVKGATITQENVTGVIYDIIDGDLLVKVEGNETFKCFNICSDLIQITTVNNGITYSTYILRGGTSRRLGSIFLSRNLLEYRDIDETLDLFIVYFKEKYLKNIEFDTATNKRLLVKNSLDLYRAKGTERAIDLFFRLVYGVKPDVEYPADYLFQASGSEWTRPTYLEISPNTVAKAIELVGKEITGVTSGAKAFVEKYIKIKITSGFSHVLFVSNIKGTFIPNELIIDDVLYPDSPVIYGSLNRVQVNFSTGGFNVGDIVDISSITGINAKGRISEIRTATGQVDFELEESGYGYSVNIVPSSVTANTDLSDNIIAVSNVQIGNVITNSLIRVTGSGYSNDDTITIFSDLGKNATAFITTDGSGAITFIDIGNQGSGFTTDDPSILRTFNTSGGTSGFIDVISSRAKYYYNLFDEIEQLDNTSSIVAKGTIIAEPKKGLLTLSSVLGSFPIGSKLIQYNSTEDVYASGIIQESNLSFQSGFVEVTDIQGVFGLNETVYIDGSSATAIIDSVELDIPVVVTQGAFVNDTSYKIRCVASGFTSNTSTFSIGSGASYNISQLQSDKETVWVNTDRISNTTLLSTTLNAAQYNLPYSVAANSASIIFSALTFDDVEIGEIKTISGINPGLNYNQDPITLTYQNFVAPMALGDVSLLLSNTSGSFVSDEIILQEYNANVITLAVGSTTGLRVNEGVYVRNLSSVNVATASVREIVSPTEINIENVDGSISVNFTIRSISNSSYVATISSFAPNSNLIQIKGRIKSISNNVITVKRLTYNDDFRADESISGQSSGVSAYVNAISVDYSSVMGYNANISATSITSNGSISMIDIVDSGFGYANNQASFTAFDGKRFSYTTFLGGLGTGTGSYRSLKGFLSDLAKLHDGDFYQEYSYNIISKIPFDRYKDMFKAALHMSGSRFFGNVLLATTLNETAINTASNTNITVSNTSPFVIFAPDLDAAPAPWNDTDVDPGRRLNDEEVEDFANSYIEIRN